MSALKHAEKIKDYATKRMAGKNPPELDIEDLAAAMTALQVWDRLIKRVTHLLCTENKTEQERVEYAALLKIKDGEVRK